MIDIPSDIVSCMRRPLHSVVSVSTAAHHAFELASGVGLVFQPYIGLARAIALWGALLPAWFVAAARGSPAWDRPLAFAAGVSLGGGAVHFTLWPSRLRVGLPFLTEAEGLRPEQLPAYNAVLYAWVAAAALALMKESPPPARRWALLGCLAALPLRASARHHFVWVREQARSNPAWWNRALREARAATPPA